MKVRIESVTRETRRDKFNNEYTGVKFQGQWYNLAGRHLDLYQKEIDVEVKGKWAKIIEAKAEPTQGHPPALSNGKIAWADCEEIMREAHALALELEPDGETTDRSTARAAILNTVMIAFTNGRVDLPRQPGADSDEPPPPSDQDYPF